MRRTKIQKKGKTTLLHDWYRNKRRPQSYRSPTSYIYIFSPRRGKTLPLAIYFNVNKRIPKEWSGLVILDFSNSSPAQRKWKRTHLPLEFALWWQSCVLVFLLPTFFVSRRIRDSFHRRRRLSHPPLRPTCIPRVLAHKSEQCTANKAPCDLLSLWFSAANWILADNASR